MLLLLLRPWRKVSVAADLVERGVINAQRPHASITLPCLRTSVSSFAIFAVVSILHSFISASMRGCQTARDSSLSVQPWPSTASTSWQPQLRLAACHA